MDNKISNVIGVPIPQWLVEQFNVRSKKGSTYDRRGTQELQFLANKTAWVRLVSSIDIKGDDLEYFYRYTSTDSNASQIKDNSSLAKNYILFAGTSKYVKGDKGSFSHELRSGISNGAYGMLGEREIKEYGYTPMPGITSVTIETMGRMGSVKSATVNFKVFDKLQLDIIDALYFKLGYTMLLEWGHTYYYETSPDTPGVEPVLKSTEDLMIDPFQANLTKDKINYQISLNVQKSYGNYDGMLGMVTNFNFSRKEDGSYDCSVKMIGLGALAESLKINRVGVYVDALKTEIAALIKSKNEEIQKESKKQQDEVIKNYESQKKELQADIKTYPTLNSYFEDKIQKNRREENENVTDYIYLSSKGDNDIVYPNSGDDIEWGLKRFGLILNKGSLIEQLSFSKSEITSVLSTMKANYWSKEDRRVKETTIKSSQDFANLPKYSVGSDTAISRGSELNIGGYDVFDLTYEKISKAQVTDKENKIITKNVVRRYLFTIGIENYTSFQRRNIVDDNGTLRDTGTIIVEQNEEATKKIKKTIFEYITNLGEQKTLEEGLSISFGKVDIDASDLKETNKATYGVGLYGRIGGPIINKNGDSTVYTPKITVAFRLVFRKEEIPKLVTGNREVSFFITISDSSLIENIQITKPNENILEFQNKFKNKEQNEKNVFDNLEKAKKDQIKSIQEQNPTIDITKAQEDEANKFKSALESALRTIQIYSLNRATQQKMSITKIDFLSENQKLAKTIFSEVGLYSQYYDKVVNNTLQDIPNYGKGEVNGDLLEFYMKYGFNVSLMSNSIASVNKSNLGVIWNAIENKLLRDRIAVNHAELLESYVIPYQVSQEFSQGVVLERPVYIKLGTLLMLFNHMSSMYESQEDKSSKKSPIFYVDYNPNTNFCLTSLNHLSTNPFNFIIPYSGEKENFKQLFEKSALEKIPDSEIFDRAKDDVYSGALPQFIENGAKNKKVYQGKVMNVLIDIDYILNTIKKFSNSDNTNSVYFKAFIDNILSDMCKALGNYNLLRLAYNDSANCFYIVDDQLIPPMEGEKEATRTSTKSSIYEIPLYGKESIAKSLDIKTDISSKLSNMIAISANSEKYQSEMGMDTTPFGYVNKNFTDRYVRNRGDSVLEDAENKKKDSSITTGDEDNAKKFNDAIKFFYGYVDAPMDYVNGATNYYISRIASIKATNPASRASAIIPVSVNFTTDGISGFNMYQSFGINEELLPYTYSAKNNVNGKSIERQVGFCVVGLSHTIENNQWNTSVRSNMIFLKDQEDYKGEKSVAPPSSDAKLRNKGYGGGSNRCDEPYTNKNLNKGWEGKKQPFKRTVIDPAIEGPKLSTKYGKTLARAVIATIKIEQNYKGFNYNFGGFDITSGGWSYNSNLHDGYVVAKEGGTGLCKAYVSFKSYEAYVEQTISSFKSKGFESADTADKYAKIWYEKWNGYGARSKYPGIPIAQIDAQNIRDAASVWNNISQYV